MSPLPATALHQSFGHSRLQQQATELEGVFLATLVKEMFSGLDASSVTGGGFGEETWRGLQAEQLADAMAQAGGIGLAAEVMSGLLATQEAAGNRA